MGLLLSRFRGKQTTIEVLEGIDKDIKKLQTNRKQNQDRQKRIVTSLLIYSIGAYVISAVIFFCLYFPDTWKLRFLYSLPLLVFPFLVWGLKKLLHWYFVKRIASNDVALQELRERKKQILEDVMETETYKKAREILEKFDPSRLRKLEGSSSGETSASPTGVNIIGTPGTVIHQRTIRTTQQVRGTPSATPRARMPTPVPRPSQPSTPYPATPALPQPRAITPSQPRPAITPAQNVRMSGGGFVPPPGPPMPRSVLPRERGTMDRLMDYLVGDGPENRYALICRQCHSHNGMALKEEYEYLSFRCCYCYSLNPARKQRPVAPRLEFFAPPGRSAQSASGDSTEESDDEDGSNDDEKSDKGTGVSGPSNTSAEIPQMKSAASGMVNTPVSSKVGPQGPKPATGPQGPRPGLGSNIPRPAAGPGQKPTETHRSRLTETQKPQPGGDTASKSSRAVDPKHATVAEPAASKDQASSQAKLQNTSVSNSNAHGRSAAGETTITSSSMETVDQYKLIKSAENVRDIPDFDKADFFSVPAGAAKVKDSANRSARLGQQHDLVEELNYNNNAEGNGEVGAEKDVDISWIDDDDEGAGKDASADDIASGASSQNVNDVVKDVNKEEESVKESTGENVAVTSQTSKDSEP